MPCTILDSKIQPFMYHGPRLQGAQAVSHTCDECLKRGEIGKGIIGAKRNA